MAEQVKARLAGDDYQHLLSWSHLLELKMPRKQAAQVTVEDPDAGSVDDVTIKYPPAAPEPARYYQIKYHVDHRDQYSTERLLAGKTEKSTSLLQKFFRTWVKLTGAGSKSGIRLYLVSNWMWDSADKMKVVLDGRDGSIKDEFHSAEASSGVREARSAWIQHLGCSEDQFRAFVGSLRFQVGHSNAEQLEEEAADRMHAIGLKCDASTLILCAGIVRRLIIEGAHVIDANGLDEIIRQNDLVAPFSPDRTATVYLTTIKEPQQFLLEPDYHLDWRHLFEGPAERKSHRILDPGSWNKAMLPELQALEPRIRLEAAARVIRIRGFARLSPWFAIGHTFPEVGRYVMEVDQNGEPWRSDIAPAPDFRMVAADDEPRGSGGAVAVGISITGSLEGDVRAYLAEQPSNVRAVRFLRPNRELGRPCLRGPADAVALAQQSKALILELVKKHRATRLLLFYYGPLSGACFLGHHLNAVCPEIQIMEDQQPGYAPSFLLK